MKRALHGIGVAASLLCVAFFIRSIGEHWSALSHGVWNAGVIVAVAASAVLYLSTFALATKAWQLLLRLFGQVRGYRPLARILMLSQLGKYLPGNVGHHVGRVVMAREADIPTESAVASMVMETVLVLVAGGVCSLPAVALLFEVAKQHQWSPTRTSVVVMALGLALLGAAFATPLLRRKTAAIAAAIPPITHSARLIGSALLIHGLSFLAGATGLFLICMGLSTAVATALAFEWVRVVGIYAVAWLLGFLMPGSPAGLGVREVVLLVGLTPLFGDQSATTAAALLRLVTITGDGVVFLIAAKVLPAPEHAALPDLMKEPIER